MAAAETDWMLTTPASKGIRERPLLMSSASASLRMLASVVRHCWSALCAAIACRISEVTMVRSSMSYRGASNSRALRSASSTLYSSCRSR